MRLLLSIGCDSYDHVSPLTGAEVDARHIYEKLTLPSIGAYSTEHSRLALSPTSDEIRRALRDLLLVGEPIDELTIYFAGHGCVGPASFYMATRDTRLDALSMTAISLSDILRAVAESKANHTNIIIDACESGGLIEDLNVILKGSLIGGAGSPGITLLAASASNEYAEETQDGGLATRALISCIDGKISVRDDKPTLELLEIGKAVGSVLSEAKQTPIVWGLNLHGISRFCANPLYSHQEADLRFALTKRGLTSPSINREKSSSLWRLYYSIPENWNGVSYISELRSALESLGQDHNDIVELAHRFCISAQAKSASSREALLPTKIYAATICALLKWVEHDCVRIAVSKFAKLLVASSADACTNILKDLSTDRYAFFRGSGGPPDFFYLPIRIFEALGWLSISLYSDAAQESTEHASSQYLLLCRHLLETYPGGFNAISEAQAPSIAATIVALESASGREISEEILGYLLLSTIDAKAMYAANDINGKDAFSYIYARANGKIADNTDIYSNPTELLTVILRLGQIIGLDDVFDQELWNFDEKSCLAFLSESMAEIGDERVRSGTNKIWTIGRNLFRLSDFGGPWIKSSSQKSRLDQICILCACLTYQDRVPWQLVDEMANSQGEMEPIAETRKAGLSPP